MKQYKLILEPLDGNAMLSHEGEPEFVLDIYPDGSARCFEMSGQRLLPDVGKFLTTWMGSRPADAPQHNEPEDVAVVFATALLEECDETDAAPIDMFESLRHTLELTRLIPGWSRNLEDKLRHVLLQQIQDMVVKLAAERVQHVAKDELAKHEAIWHGSDTED